MTSMRGLGAGVCLLLILTGCSSDPDGTIDDAGVYSPIIAGIAANNEPAVRGEVNEFTVLVTNVNNYPVTYHWSAGAGTLTDSIGATASWTALDPVGNPLAVGTYPLTVSIESRDDVSGTPFFQSTTFQIFTDNQFVRWTTSPEVQFDPAPTPSPSGGVLFAQITNNTTGAADVYHAPAPGIAVQLVTGFATLTSPTMRADGQQIAFAGKRLSSAAGPSVWLLPAAGGDTSTAVPAALASSGQITLANPRFARAGNWLLYNSDSTSPLIPRPWFRDALNLAAPPQRVIAQGVSLVSTTFWMPAWGPDTDANGIPDSIVCPGYRFFGATNQQGRGLFKLPTAPEQTTAPQWLPDSSAAESDWSADGQHIVYAKRDKVTGDRDIWIINAGSMDPSSARRVTFGPADDSHPRFSPDGTLIYFVSNRADHYGLNGIFNTERRGTNIWSVARFDLP